MTTAKKFIPLVLLVISLYGLWTITADRLPWQKQAIDLKPGEIARVSLGQVAVQNYGKMGFTKGSVSYVPGNDSPKWAVGTENGEILLIDNSGAIIWRRSLGIGKINTIKVTVDGKQIIVGETSPTGTLYAIDVTNGKVLWTYDTSMGIGSTPQARSLPSLTWLDVDKIGNIYAAAYRLGDKRSYTARIFAFSPKGNLLWQFPENEAMDAWSNYAAVSDNDNALVFSTATYETKPGTKYPHTLYWLDKKIGREILNIDLPETQLGGRAVIRSSPNYAADGQTLAFITSDGRAYYYTKDGQQIWQRTISSPAQIAGTWINSIGRVAYVLEDQVVFTTINTYNRDNWQLPTPLEHPSSNSIFIFDKTGNLENKITVGGNIEDLVFFQKTALIAVGRNIQVKDYSIHGVRLYDLTNASILFEFKTAGPCQNVAISPDGQYIAAVEVPAALDDNKIIGDYMLHIIKRSL